MLHELFCNVLVYKGTHLITGAIMLNGIACGMIYRPLKATTRKPDMGAPASDRLRHSAVALDEEQYIRATSINSLSPDGTAITNDMCFVRVNVSDSISQSVHAVNDVSPSFTKVSALDTNCAVTFASYNKHICVT